MSVLSYPLLVQFKPSNTSFLYVFFVFFFCMAFYATTDDMFVQTQKESWSIIYYYRYPIFQKIDSIYLILYKLK